MNLFHGQRCAELPRIHLLSSFRIVSVDIIGFNQYYTFVNCLLDTDMIIYNVDLNNHHFNRIGGKIRYALLYM